MAAIAAHDPSNRQIVSQPLPPTGAPMPVRAAYPLHLMAVLCALMGFASISTDFYLPAMPTMARAFGVGHGTMEWTIAAYLVGFSWYGARSATGLAASGPLPLAWYCSS
jgi:hypothetical protein